MKSLTAAELEKIIFLERCGVSYDEIIDVINGDREEAEISKHSDINCYLQCVLEEEEV